MASKKPPQAEERRKARLEARTPALQRCLLATFATLTTFLLAVFLHTALARLGPPDLSRYEDTSQVVTERTGAILRGYLSGDESWRLAVRPEDVSPLYLAMLKAYEDKRFARHGGVDLLALLRAGWQALAHGRIVSGASTLTMQTARLLEPRPRGLSAKLIEMVRARQLEARLSKDEIMAIYLTLAPFGGNLEGLRAASLAYFNKEPRVLTPAEAALLVVLPQSPNRLRPDRYPARARAARAKVLERAAARGVIDARRAAEAKSAALPGARRPLPFLAPHLADRLRRARPDARTIATTLDGGLQADLEAMIRDAARALDPGAGAAAVIVDNASLEVRAHVGAPDYFSQRRDGMVDMTRAVRSPGSALKPFVYGLAFDALIAHPDSLIRDAPRRFGGYAPRNFNRGFAGDVTLREALQLSLNVPAVALLERVGPLRFERRLADAGAGLHRAPGEAPSLALALGGLGVTLEDLVALYAAIANGGRAGALRATPDGPARAPAAPLMGPVAAWYLADVLAGTPRPAGYLDAAAGGRSGAVAFKTGTSYGQRDAWAVGFTARVTIGVWVGRPDGAPCAGCVGIQTAAPVLFRAFDLLAGAGGGGAAARPPAGALAGPTAALPPGLRRFGPRDAPARRGKGPPPRIAFPLDGAIIAAEKKGSDPGSLVPLKAEGGKRPYRWLVDGRPLGGPVWRRGSHWSPDAPGFARLQLVDAEGRSSQVRVRIDRLE